jgi:hypothetical protein
MLRTQLPDHRPRSRFRQPASIDIQFYRSLRQQRSQFGRCLLWDDRTKGDAADQSVHHVANRQAPKSLSADSSRHFGQKAS